MTLRPPARVDELLAVAYARIAELEEELRRARALVDEMAALMRAALPAAAEPVDYTRPSDWRSPLPTKCPDCGEPQFLCPAGTSCPNGHGYQ
jgi:hypothetical protein